MLIDAHVHVFDPVAFPIDPASGGYIPRDDECADVSALQHVLSEHQVSGAVVVQASAYGFDNAIVLDACDALALPARGVSMTDVASLPELAKTPEIRGVRLNLTDFSGHRVASAASLARAVLQHDLILQLQAPPRTLASLLDAVPAGPVILDHLGLPDPLNSGDLSAVAAMADREDTYLKVSGGFRLAQEGDWRRPTEAIRALVSGWPRDRRIWGSDWPFINLSAPTPQYEQTIDWGQDLTDLERASETAARLFGLPTNA